jgi:antitoxin component of RelBE/YafQ-DinJ toxin-antitoxin module
MANKKIHIRIREEDRERLEQIRDTLGVSMAGAFRAALVSLSKQLGFEKEPPEMIGK